MKQRQCDACFPISSARFLAQSGNGAFQSLGGVLLGFQIVFMSAASKRRICRSCSYVIKFF